MRNQLSFIAIMMLGVWCPVESRAAFAVKNCSKFYTRLRQQNYPYSVVFVYEQDKKNNCPQEARSIEPMLAMVNYLSDVWLYREGGLQFIKVNIAKNDLRCVMEEYGVYTVPAFIIFYDGMPLVDPDTGSYAILHGYVDGQDVREFIEKYLTEALQERADARQLERQYAAESAAYYWGCWGWPYGSCGPYYGPCGGGCGWGGCYQPCGVSFGMGVCL